MDFFVLGERPFDREEMRRAVRIRWPGEPALEVTLKSAEDLVLRKLEWFRLGNQASDRQWQDILGVLRTMRGRLDEAHMDHWAAQLAVEDLLGRARKEVL